MRFEAFLAWRYVLTSRGQTALTVAAVAAAVCLIIVFNSLLMGVQQRIVTDLIGSIAHITVRMPDPDPQPLQDSPQASYATTTRKNFKTRSDLRRPEVLEEILSSYPFVKVAASSVGGQAFLIRGVRQFGVTVRGANPLKQELISNLEANMVSGRWLDIGPNDLVIGTKLAEDTGLSLGDMVTLITSEQIQKTFRIAGTFHTGQNVVDGGTVFCTLAAAQQAFATRKDANSILIKLDDPWAAERVAHQITDSLGLKAESWITEQAQFVNAMTAQDGVRMLINVFSLAAASFGIASVLIVSVFQRSRQIGILKSMGASDAQILRVFTLQGFFVSILGSSVGAVFSYGLIRFLGTFKQVARVGKSDNLFPTVMDANVFVIAILAAILATQIASLLPAYRASRTNPVEVINEG